MLDVRVIIYQPLCTSAKNTKVILVLKNGARLTFTLSLGTTSMEFVTMPIN